MALENNCNLYKKVKGWVFLASTVNIDMYPKAPCQKNPFKIIKNWKKNELQIFPYPSQMVLYSAPPSGPRSWYSPRNKKKNTKRQIHKYKDKDNVKYTNTLWPIIIFNVVKSDKCPILKFLGWLVFWIFGEKIMSHGNGSNFLTKKARRLALVPKFAHRDGLEVTAN